MVWKSWMSCLLWQLEWQWTLDSVMFLIWNIHEDSGSPLRLFKRLWWSLTLTRWPLRFANLIVNLTLHSSVFTCMCGCVCAHACACVLGYFAWLACSGILHSKIIRTPIWKGDLSWFHWYMCRFFFFTLYRHSALINIFEYLQIGLKRVFIMVLCQF